MQKRIFTYWVSGPGQKMPDYIKICMESWKRHIEGLEIVVIDHDNLAQWIDLTMDLQAFKQLSLPMQSDIVLYYVLYKHGGIYMDADTIVTKDIFEQVERFDRRKIYAFGNPKESTIHVAFIASLQKGQKMLFNGIRRAQSNLSRLSRGQIGLTWDLFSNSIYHELIRDDNKGIFEILHREESGSILETVMQKELPGDNYFYFYFDKKRAFHLEELLARIKFGVVLLHNSWTPDEYKSAARDVILDDDMPLSRLLQYAIGSAG